MEESIANNTQVQHEMDGEVGFPSPVWTQEADTDGLVHDVDQENRLKPNDIVEEDERRRGPTHGVLPWPRPAAAYQAPPHRPVLPREPQGIGSNGEGGTTGLINNQDKSSRRGTRPAIPGLVRPHQDQARESTGLPETGEC